MQALLITSCDDKFKWYSGLVGTIVDLLAEEESEYKSLEPMGYINFVSKEDAKVVTLCGKCTSVLTTDHDRIRNVCKPCRLKEMGYEETKS